MKLQKIHQIKTEEQAKIEAIKAKIISEAKELQRKRENAAKADTVSDWGILGSAYNVVAGLGQAVARETGLLPTGHGSDQEYKNLIPEIRKKYQETINKSLQKIAKFDQKRGELKERFNKVKIAVLGSEAQPAGRTAEEQIKSLLAYIQKAKSGLPRLREAELNCNKNIEKLTEKCADLEKVVDGDKPIEGANLDKLMKADQTMVREWREALEPQDEKTQRLASLKEQYRGLDAQQGELIAALKSAKAKAEEQQRQLDSQLIEITTKLVAAKQILKSLLPKEPLTHEESKSCELFFKTCVDLGMTLEGNRDAAIRGIGKSENMKENMTYLNTRLDEVKQAGFTVGQLQKSLSTSLKLLSLNGKDLLLKIPNGVEGLAKELEDMGENMTKVIDCGTKEMPMLLVFERLHGKIEVRLFAQEMDRQRPSTPLLLATIQFNEHSKSDKLSSEIPEIIAKIAQMQALIKIMEAQTTKDRDKWFIPCGTEKEPMLLVLQREKNNVEVRLVSSYLTDPPVQRLGDIKIKETLKEHVAAIVEQKVDEVKEGIAEGTRVAIQKATEFKEGVVQKGADMWGRLSGSDSDQSPSKAASPPPSPKQSPQAAALPPATNSTLIMEQLIESLNEVDRIAKHDEKREDKHIQKTSMQILLEGALGHYDEEKQIGIKKMLLEPIYRACLPLTEKKMPPKNLGLLMQSKKFAEEFLKPAEGERRA